MYSFGVISPYFINGTGHWPANIEWFFASCKANPTIDFHIITDDVSVNHWNHEKNIFIHIMTFEDCKKRILDIFDYAKINRPYKLCDYRHAYGIIFKDILGKYDFWASCDCDLMFGNIREFFPDERLEQYDKMMVTGQFQISKNTPEVNNYYCLPRPADSKYKDFNWEKVSRNEGNFGYDEGTGVPMLVRENGKPILWDMKMYANIHQRVKNGKHLYNHMVDKNEAANRPFQYWHWKDGGIYHVDALTKKEVPKLFIHFTERDILGDQYEGQTEIFITQKSEFRSTIKFKDTVVGWDFVRVMTKKTFIWIKWKLTHLKGKKSWEM